MWTKLYTVEIPATERLPCNAAAMARLLYITNGLTGGLNANYELARRLAKAGHTVGFLGYGDVGDSVRGQGYSFIHVTQADRAMDQLRADLGRVGRVRAFPRGVALRRHVIGSREIEAAVSAARPDALIVDIEAHYSILATRSLGIPTVLKNDFFSLAWERGVPPMHSEQPYPRGRRDRVTADIAWLRAYAERRAAMTVGELYPAKWTRRWAPFRYNTVSRRDLRAVARSRDIRLGEITSQRDWLRPHTYPGLPMITATARELDFVQATSLNDQWIGPLVYRDRVDIALGPEDRERWHAFRDRNRSSGRPLLYCSFGTMVPGTSAMLARVLAAARIRPEYDVVVGLGGRDEKLVANANENILVLDYAPQLEVLEVADAAMILGGINTINECLTFGVPMIVEQTGPTDGPGNANRVAHHGVGVRAQLGSIEPERLANLIDRVLHDHELRGRVRTMQTTFQRYEDDQIAEAAIEQLLAGRLDATLNK